MYLSYYKLRKKPFQISTDPEFLWLGEKHLEALATLKYGVLDNKGFLLLTGDVGTGKTTLINALVDSLGDEVVVARVPDPGMDRMDLMNYICHAFSIGKEFIRKDLFLVHFGHFLNTAYTRRKKVLLLIDEAQRMSQDLLEEVRQLSNLERYDQKLLNIFLIGQNEFNGMLVDERNKALLQRITMQYNLKPLDEPETGELIRHRLQVAGAEQPIFTPEALAAVYGHTQGTPRKINILCDHCLITGFARGARAIDERIVEFSAAQLKLPVYLKPSIEMSESTEDIGDLLPEEDLYDTEQEVVDEQTENDEMEEEEGAPSPEILNSHYTGWSPGAVATLVCAGMVLFFLFSSEGIGESAHRLKQAGRNVISFVLEVSGRQLSQGNDTVSGTVSSVMNEAKISLGGEQPLAASTMVSDAVRTSGGKSISVQDVVIQTTSDQSGKPEEQLVADKVVVSGSSASEPALEDSQESMRDDGKSIVYADDSRQELNEPVADSSSTHPFMRTAALESVGTEVREPGAPDQQVEQPARSAPEVAEPRQEKEGTIRVSKDAIQVIAPSVDNETISPEESAGQTTLEPVNRDEVSMGDLENEPEEIVQAQAADQQGMRLSEQDTTHELIAIQAADNSSKRPSATESATTATEERHDYQAEPIDSSKVIDWLLNNRRP